MTYTFVRIGDFMRLSGKFTNEKIKEKRYLPIIGFEIHPLLKSFLLHRVRLMVEDNIFSRFNLMSSIKQMSDGIFPNKFESTFSLEIQEYYSP